MARLALLVDAVFGIWHLPSQQTRCLRYHYLVNPVYCAQFPSDVSAGVTTAVPNLSMRACYESHCMFTFPVRFRLPKLSNATRQSKLSVTSLSARLTVLKSVHVASGETSARKCLRETPFPYQGRIRRRKRCESSCNLDISELFSFLSSVRIFSALLIIPEVFSIVSFTASFMSD